MRRSFVLNSVVETSPAGLIIRFAVICFEQIRYNCQRKDLKGCVYLRVGLTYVFNSFRERESGQNWKKQTDALA